MGNLVMIKCSFCEQTLVCKMCKKLFRPRRGETYVGVFQPDMAISCPECQKTLVCQACGYSYGKEEESEEDSP
jgi:hypothetical protein